MLGLFLLGALWLEALLVAGAVWGDLRERRMRTVAAAFIVMDLALCSACTVLAAHPPVFGPVSTLGAALCLVFFLALTPAAVWVTRRPGQPRAS